MAGAEIKAGIYKGRAVAGSAQYGLSKQSQAQVAIDVAIPSLGITVTIPLSFAERAMPFSIERLRACGWRGADIRQLDGIDAEEVDVQISFETWEGKQRLRAEIRTGYTFPLEYTMKDADLGAFAADVAKFIKDEGATKRAGR